MINAVSSAPPSQNRGNGDNTVPSVPSAPPAAGSPPPPAPSGINTIEEAPSSTYSNSLAEKINTPISADPGAAGSSIPPVPPPPSANDSFTISPTGGDGGGNNDGGTKDKKSFAKRFSPKMIVGAILLFLLILGSGAGLYLSQQSQDLRQQADEVSCETLNLDETGCGEAPECAWIPANTESCSTFDDDFEQCYLATGCSIAPEAIEGESGACIGTHIIVPGRCITDQRTCTCDYGEAQGQSGPATCNDHNGNPYPQANRPNCAASSQSGGTPPGDDSGETPPFEGQDLDPRCATCVGSCGHNGCSINCDGIGSSECGYFPVRFQCEGFRETDGCNDQSGITLGSNPDYSEPQNWCKTYQFDSNTPDHAVSVVRVGDNGDYCVEGQTCRSVDGADLGFSDPSRLDWDCDNEPVLSCNSECSNDAQCTVVDSNYRCLPTFTFQDDAGFTNGSADLRPAGQGSHNLPQDGTLQSVSRFIASSVPHIRQQVVIGGRIYGRTSDDNNSWTDYTNSYGLPPEAINITSFSAYENASGQIVQHVVASGLIWYRSNATNNVWTRIHPRNTGGNNEPRLNLPNQASGTITHYSVMRWGSIVDQRVVIGGNVWYRQGTPAPEGRFSDWVNVTTYLENGTGNITSYVNHIDQQGNLRQHYVRGGQLWYRVNNSDGNKCRLAQSANSNTCGIAPPPPTPTPQPDPLQCNSTCDPNNDRCPSNLACQNIDGVHLCRTVAFPLDNTCNQTPLACNDSCTNSNQCGNGLICDQGQCRLEANPSSNNCTLGEPSTCNEVCDPSANAGTSGSCAAGLICHQTGDPMSSDSIHRCRLPSNPNNPACTAAPQCVSIEMNLSSPAGNSTPQIGDSVSFTCGQVAGVDSYSFTVTAPGASPSPLPVSSSQPNRSVNLPINVHGSYNAQCFINVDYTDDTDDGNDGGGNEDNGGNDEDDDVTEPPEEPGVCGVDYSCSDRITCADNQLAACAADGGCRCNPRPNPDSCQLASDCTNTCQTGETRVCRANTCGCLNESSGGGGGSGGGGNEPGGTGGGTGSDNSCQLASDCRNTCLIGQVRTCIEGSCGCARGSGGGGGGTSNM